MVKKFLGAILLSIALLFGLNSTAQAAPDPKIPGCVLNVRSSGDANFKSGGTVQVHKNESLVIQASGLINLPSLGSEYNDDEYYIGGLRENETANTNTWVYISNAQASGGTFTTEKPLGHFTFARTDHLNPYITHLYVAVDPSKGTGSPAHEIYCRSKQRIEFVDSIRGESCSINVNVYRDESTRNFYVAATINTSSLVQSKGYYIRMFEAGGVMIINDFFTASPPSYITIWGDAAHERQLFDPGYEGKNQILFVTDGSNNICQREFDFPANAKEIDPNTFKWDKDLPSVLEIIPIPLFTLCGQIPESNPQRAACEVCSSETDDEGRPLNVYTALGCVPIDERGFLRQAITLLLSVSGIVALLSILAGAFLLSTSQGDTNQVKKARELITAAVSGLLFIIFSVIILDFIGVQILRIPGLS